ncbi:hypothetical protein BHE74_00017847 [Ensete ventricosum]|nr:hypothetical protein BHE74_00017847 [Ensete ventricosum]
MYVGGVAWLPLGARKRGRTVDGPTRFVCFALARLRILQITRERMDPRLPLSISYLLRCLRFAFVCYGIYPCFPDGLSNPIDVLFGLIHGVFYSSGDGWVRSGPLLRLIGYRLGLWFVDSQSRVMNLLELSDLATFDGGSSGVDHGVMPNLRRVKSEENSSLDQNTCAEVNEVVGENDPGSVLPLNIPAFGACQAPAGGHHVNRAVQDMLLQGLGKIIDPKDIVGIHRTPLRNDVGLVRYNIFQEWVETTKKARGNANVRYAWLASTKDAVEEMIMHGVMKPPFHKRLYGNGIHLTPANCSNIW